jgi:hypothetical protein
MPRRLLVVTTTEVADRVLRDLVRSRAGADAEMLVVAPASGISRLDWLAKPKTTPAPTRRVVAHLADQAGWSEEGAPAEAPARFSLPISVVTVAEDGSLASPNE